MTGLHLNLNLIVFWQKKHLADLTFNAKQPNALLIFIEAKFSRIWRYDNVCIDNAWLPARRTCNSYLDLTLVWRSPAPGESLYQ